MNKEMLDDVKRHLDYVNATNQKSIRDIEMQEMYFEIERLNNKVEELMTLYTTERYVKEDYKAIIKEVREYITTQKLHKFQDTTGGLTYQERKLLEILDKEK